MGDKNNMENQIEKKLKIYSKFRTEEDVYKFDEIISCISESQDPKYIPLLMEILDDNTNFPEVMYNVVHALESYPDDIHAKAIITSTPFMLKHAPQWLFTLTYATLNNPSSLEFFRKNMHLISQESMIQLLDLVAKESEHHRDLCNELKKELLESSSKE